MPNIPTSLPKSNGSFLNYITARAPYMWTLTVDFEIMVCQ